MASVTYSGTFGYNRAGSSGQSIAVSGGSIPSGKKITSISYSILMHANRYSSSNEWCVHWFAIGSADGSPYVSYSETTMQSDDQTISGNMKFSASDVSVFENGSFTLYAKVNCNLDSATSYMDDFSITVYYTDDEESGGGSGSIAKSTGTLNKTSVYPGENITLNITSSNTAVTHNVTQSLGGSLETKTAGANGSVTFSPAYIYLNEIPRSTSGQMMVSLETIYNGVSQGANTYYFTLNVPDDVVPTIESLTLERIDNDVPANWGILVQKKSGLNIIANNCAGAYGSTITSWRISGGVSAIASQNSYTIESIKESGEITYTMTVVDSRGRTASKSETVMVYPYEPPTFSSTSASRCNENGELSETGTYIWAKTGYSYSDCGGKNDVVMTAEYTPHDTENWIGVGVADMEADTPYVFGDGTVDLTRTYRVRFTLEDLLGSVVTKIVDVSTSQYTMFFKRGGQAVAFGKEASVNLEKVVEISEDWQLLVGGVDVFAKLTELEARLAALEG